MNLNNQIIEIKKQLEHLSWWSADDGASRLGNLELQMKEINKKLNILIKASKIFKTHLKDKECHGKK